MCTLPKVIAYSLLLYAFQATVSFQILKYLKLILKKKNIKNFFNFLFHLNFEFSLLISNL